MDKVNFLQTIFSIAGKPYFLYLEYCKDIVEKIIYFDKIKEQNILIVKDSDNNIIEDAIFCIIVKDNIICNNLTNYATEIINLLKYYNDKKDMYIYVYPEKINKDLFCSLQNILHYKSIYMNVPGIFSANMPEDLIVFFRTIVSEYLAIELCMKSGYIIEFFNETIQSNSNVAIISIRDAECSGIKYIGNNLKKNKEFMVSALKKCEKYIFECSVELLIDNDILQLAVKLSENLDKIYYYNYCIDKILKKNYELKYNKNFILFAVEIDGRNISKASIELQKDLDIMKMSEENYVYIDSENKF